MAGIFGYLVYSHPVCPTRFGYSVVPIDIGMRAQAAITETQHFNGERAQLTLATECESVMRSPFIDKKRLYATDQPVLCNSLRPVHLRRIIVIVLERVRCVTQAKPCRNEIEL